MTIISEESEQKQLPQEGQLNAVAKLRQGLKEEKDYSKKWRSLFFFTMGTHEEKAAIADLKESDPTQFQQIAATQLDLANSYYISIRNQSEQSFLWSRITLGIGFVVFLVAVAFFIFRLESIAYISAFGGILVEVYAGLVQWQGKLAADQANVYHVRLDRIQRFIVANSACEGLIDPEKYKKRAEIIGRLVG